VSEFRREAAPSTLQQQIPYINAEALMRVPVSCIICAYNEAPRIARVLSAVVGHPAIDEVIVVDDGSSDATVQEIGAFPEVGLIRHASNMGKSCAVATGIGKARHDLILLLDADLIGLTKEDIDRLIEPVRAGDADVSLSLRANSLGVHKLVNLDFTSGERVFHKSLLVPHFERLRTMPAFGFEVYMNQVLVDRRCRVRVVPWAGVSHARKANKRGVREGLLAETVMVLQVLQTRSLLQLLFQNIWLLVLSLSPASQRRQVFGRIADFW
jgi:glycosyltransferase involved in cell wall biosynthesis